MKKTVTYSVVGRVNPADRESGEVKYYAQSQARGEMGIREIAERIHQMCTVTRADVMAVLTGLQLSLSGGGSDTEDTYTDALIDKVRVLFRPGTAMQEAIGNLAFEKVPVKYKKEEETDEGLGA